MQRFANLSGFSLLVNLICCSIVWRARHQLVDNVIAALFLLQAAFDPEPDRRCPPSCMPTC
jgi:hypothetical protein